MTENFDIFNIYIIGIIENFLLFYFYAKILKKKVILHFYFAFAICAGILTYFVPVSTILGFGMFVLLLMAGGIWICHADFKSALFYAALVTEMMLLCYRNVKYLLSALYPLMSDSLQDMNGIVFMAAGELLFLILSGFCYYMIYCYFSSYTSKEMQYMFLVMIPIFMIFIMSEYTSTIEFSVTYEGDTWPVAHLFSHWQLLVVHLLGLASLFCILFAYKKLVQSFRLSAELSLLEQEEHFLSQYVEEAKTRYDNTKSFRHDIRNHITVMKELLQSGKLEQVICYIEDMDDLAEKMSFPCSTNNPVVDVLIGNKLGIAKSMGICVDCSLLLPYPCGLRDIDICIVLSNALDNAICACRSLAAGGEKYIHVSGRIQGDFLMIETENSFYGKEALKKGTGLSNIKAVAEKYGGSMNIETKGDVFVLHVLLIIP